MQKRVNRVQLAIKRQLEEYTSTIRLMLNKKKITQEEYDRLLAERMSINAKKV